MTDEQLAALLAYAGRLDSRVRRTLADPQQAARTIDEWTTALADVPATLPDTRWDAAHAVRRYYEQQAGNRSAQFRTVEPHDVLAAWAPHRGELMNRHTDPVPTVDPDDVHAYRAELAGTRAAVAAGRTPPVQYRAAINPAGQKRLAALTSGIGTGPRRYLPEHLAAELDRLPAPPCSTRGRPRRRTARRRTPTHADGAAPNPSSRAAPDTAPAAKAGQPAPPRTPAASTPPAAPPSKTRTNTTASPAS